MAIHPGVALGFRPPQLAPLEIQSPLDRYQKMLTLRHLMQQGQLGQMNIEQTGLENEALRQARQDEQAARALYAGGTEPTASELYAKVGPKTGLSIQRAQQEFQKARLEKQISDLELAKKRTERMSQLAAGIRGPEQWKSTVLQATSEELIPPEVGRQLLESGYDPKTVEQFVAQALDGVQRHNIAIADAKEKRDALLFPLQERKATADAQTAEQTASGTQPLTPYQQAQLEQGKYGKTEPYPQPVQTQKVEEAGALASARTNVLETPEKIEQDLEKKRREAEISNSVNKALSGEASKVYAIATTMGEDINKLRAAFQKDYRGSQRQLLMGTDRDLRLAAERLADKVGRLRSGGAINKEEESRFMGQIASWKSYGIGDSAAGLNALNQIEEEAGIVARSIRPQGESGTPGTATQTAAPPKVKVWNEKTNRFEER